MFIATNGRPYYFDSFSFNNDFGVSYYPTCMLILFLLPPKEDLGALSGLFVLPWTIILKLLYSF
jgi:hypothetical protein